jgi:hypothetical protein
MRPGLPEAQIKTRFLLRREISAGCWRMDVSGTFHGFPLGDSMVEIAMFI